MQNTWKIKVSRVGFTLPCLNWNLVELFVTWYVEIYISMNVAQLMCQSKARLNHKHSAGLEEFCFVIRLSHCFSDGKNWTKLAENCRMLLDCMRARVPYCQYRFRSSSKKSAHQLSCICSVHLSQSLPEARSYDPAGSLLAQKPRTWLTTCQHHRTNQVTQNVGKNVHRPSGSLRFNTIVEVPNSGSCSRPVPTSCAHIIVLLVSSHKSVFS